MNGVDEFIKAYRDKPELRKKLCTLALGGLTQSCTQLVALCTADHGTDASAMNEIASAAHKLANFLGALRRSDLVQRANGLESAGRAADAAGVAAEWRVLGPEIDKLCEAIASALDEIESGEA